MNLSSKQRIIRHIRHLDDAVVLRSDFLTFKDYRKVSRILTNLVTEGFISRIGYGIYLKYDCCLSIPDVVQSVKKRLPKDARRLITVEGVTISVGLKKADTGEGRAQKLLDDFKLKIAKEIIASFPLKIIREKSLSNLARWQANEVWCSAFEEWRNLLRNGTNKEILYVMTSADEKSNRLRQSPPYSGLLDKKTVEALRVAK